MIRHEDIVTHCIVMWGLGTGLLALHLFELCGNERQQQYYAIHPPRASFSCCSMSCRRRSSLLRPGEQLRPGCTYTAESPESAAGFWFCNSRCLMSLISSASSRALRWMGRYPGQWKTDMHTSSSSLTGSTAARGGVPGAGTSNLGSETKTESSSTNDVGKKYRTPLSWVQSAEWGRDERLTSPSHSMPFLLKIVMVVPFLMGTAPLVGTKSRRNLRREGERVACLNGCWD